MNTFMQGLEVSLIGLVITFLALGIFILIIVLLKKVFPYREEGEEEAGETEEAPALAVTELVEGEEAEIAAAITAALTYVRSRSRSQLGGSLAENRSGWWSARRAEANIGRTEPR